MYKKVLLKLSGEVLSGEGNKGFSSEAVDYVAREIKEVTTRGVNLGIVIGAGNLARGAELEGVDSRLADDIGMLGTVMNCIYLKDAFEKHGIKTVIVSNIVNVKSVKPIQYDDINEYFEHGYVVIFGGGTSNPFCTTDSASSLRAIEMKADMWIKATKVDGIYDKDPKKNPDAVKFNTITYQEAINKNVKVMDVEAFSMCQRYNMPIAVIDFFTKGNLMKFLDGGNIGTKVIP